MPGIKQAGEQVSESAKNMWTFTSFLWWIHPVYQVSHLLRVYSSLKEHLKDKQTYKNCDYWLKCIDFVFLSGLELKTGGGRVW